MSEADMHRFWHLNTWSPLGVTVWEGLGGVAMWEKACCWGWVLRFQTSLHSQLAVSASCSGLKMWAFSDCCSHHACCLLSCLSVRMGSYPSRTINPKEVLPSISCPGPGVLSQQQKCRINFLNAKSWVFLTYLAYLLFLCSMWYLLYHPEGHGLW